MRARFWQTTECMEYGMSRFVFCVVAVTVALGLAVNAEAAYNTSGVFSSATGITVDGDPTDWGITQNPAQPDVLNYAGYTVQYSVDPSFTQGIRPGFWGTDVLHYIAEDTTTNKVGPLYGGQNYDTGFLGAMFHIDPDNPTLNKLYIGIATGQRADNGSTKFAPGDVRIAYALGGSDYLYGVEVGGGLGGSGLVTDVETGDDGTTYALTSSGYTDPPIVSHDSTGGQVAGSIWNTTSGQWSTTNPTGLPTQLKNPTSLAGTADLFYKDLPDMGSIDSQNAFIELSLDLADIGLNPFDVTTLNVAWRPSCGNDDSWTEVSVVLGPPPPEVPEPASIAVWGLLILAVSGGAYWRRRGKNA